VPEPCETLIKDKLRETLAESRAKIKNIKILASALGPQVTFL